jgi:hypothetical protein
VDFAGEIFRAVAACTVLLAIIGPARADRGPDGLMIPMTLCDWKSRPT